MDFTLSQDLEDIRAGVRELCDGFGVDYWRGLEPDRYPEEFVRALTEHGWLAALIPERYGGAGLELDAASVILEEINAQRRQRRRLPRADVHDGHAAATRLGGAAASAGCRRSPPASCGCRPSASPSPTPARTRRAIQTRAQRTADGYVVNGQKVWTSRAPHSDLMLLLARTTPARGGRAAHRRACRCSSSTCASAAPTLEIRPIETMINHATTEVFFNDLELPADALIGEEGKGFRYVLDGMNAERILIAAECIGDGRFFVERAARYAARAGRLRAPDRRQPGRAVPDRARPHGDRGGGPDALEGAQRSSRPGSPAAPRRTWRSSSPRRPPGRPRTPASTPTAASASPLEYDIERKFRETRLYTIAPVSNNLVLAYVGQHVLGMPRSY